MTVNTSFKQVTNNQSFNTQTTKEECKESNTSTSSSRTVTVVSSTQTTQSTQSKTAELRAKLIESNAKTVVDCIDKSFTDEVNGCAKIINETKKIPEGVRSFQLSDPSLGSVTIGMNTSKLLKVLVRSTLDTDLKGLSKSQQNFYQSVYNSALKLLYDDKNTGLRSQLRICEPEIRKNENIDYTKSKIIQSMIVKAALTVPQKFLSLF